LDFSRIVAAMTPSNSSYTAALDDHMVTLCDHAKAASFPTCESSAEEPIDGIYQGMVFAGREC
jgi:hypothetical protein